MSPLKVIIGVVLIWSLHSVVPQPKNVLLTGGHLKLTSVPILKAHNVPFDTKYYFDKIVDRRVKHLSKNSLDSAVSL